MNIALYILLTANLILIALLVFYFIKQNGKSNNSAISLDLDKKIDELNKFQVSVLNFIYKQEEFNKEIIRTISDNDKNVNKTINDFTINFIKENSLQKEQIMQKISSEIKEFNQVVEKTISDFNTSIKDKLNDFKDNTRESIKGVELVVEKNLHEIRDDNNKKLEKINDSVNEKLQKTLEEKLKSSFESVVEGIGSVNKTVGEIKGIASDVGSLISVLTNVKTKGIMGEVILSNILSEFLTTNQYSENIVTKKGSSERVEFAIKLPGTGDNEIYLPVDSKFPYQSYSIIVQSNDIGEIERARKELRNNLISYAKSVSQKYIDVPNTTDFAIIFLPLEGLYLEALNLGLFEELQRKYRVNLTGPTTFTAFVNSLNVGFRSLMIQKKSLDVFKILGAVKTEFGKFAEALEKTQERVNKAADELDNLVGTRTRMMNSKLKSIEAIDEQSANDLLEVK